MHIGGTHARHHIVSSARIRRLLQSVDVTKHAGALHTAHGKEATAKTKRYCGWCVLTAALHTLMPTPVPPIYTVSAHHAHRRSTIGTQKNIVGCNEPANRIKRNYT